MRGIIGKMLANTLSYLNDWVCAIIRLTSRKWIYSLYKKLSQAPQRLRNWTHGNWQRHASSEDEGLGSDYDKSKWVKAYYEKTDQSMDRTFRKGMNNT